MNNTLNISPTRFFLIFLGTAGLLLGLAATLACKGDDSPRGSGQVNRPWAVKPVIKAMEPKAGSGGAEVMIHGTGLKGAKVTFEGRAVTVVAEDDGTRLRVLVPSLAAGTGAFTVKTPGGEVKSPAFEVLLCRADALGQAFHLDVSRELLGPMADFPAVRRTKQYDQLRLPQACIFHAYNPLTEPDSAEDPLRSWGHFPCYPLNVKFPSAYVEALPKAVLAKVQELGIARDKVEVFMVWQGQAWVAKSLLLRPQYWTDPDAPNHGTYSTERSIGAGVFSDDPAIRFQGHPGAGHWEEAKITVHPTTNSASDIISSPNNLRVEGLDPEKSHAFWTLVRFGDRAAATLHLLLDDNDLAEAKRMLPELKTLQNLRHLAGGAGNFPIFARVGEPFRPVVYGTRVDKASGHLMLTGSGFTGATKVAITERPNPHAVITHHASKIKVVDDHTLEVDMAIPAVAAEIVVISPAGKSDPQALAR